MVNAIQPRQRFVLIGASNATMGFPTIVEIARRRAGEALEIMAATTLGRSFGKKSKIFFRRISSILDCSLWRDLETRPSLPTRALVTDIGNDILYGEPVERIAEWVARCIERLRDAGAHVALTQLPLASLEALENRRYLLFRQLLFPRSRLSLDEARDRANQLNACVVEIANRHEIKAITHLPKWYGFDPIHFHKRHRTAAWSDILAALFGEAPKSPWKSRSLSHAAYLHALAPAERWLFGIRSCRSQPAGRLRDGTTISLY